MATACSVVLANDSPFSNINEKDIRNRACNFALVAVSLVSICIMVACGVMIIREYSLSKSYKHAMCTKENITFEEQYESCQFCMGTKDKTKDKSQPGCVTSYFPCVQITVLYESADGTAVKALLHSDSLQAAGIHRKCSFSVCQEHQEDNKKAVIGYAEQWESIDDLFHCFYNTENTYDVIANKMYSESDVIHSMLWPSIVLIICVLIFLKLEIRRRHLTCCGKEHKRNVNENIKLMSASADGVGQTGVPRGAKASLNVATNNKIAKLSINKENARERQSQTTPTSLPTEYSGSHTEKNDLCGNHVG